MVLSSHELPGIQGVFAPGERSYGENFFMGPTSWVRQSVWHRSLAGIVFARDFGDRIGDEWIEGLRRLGERSNAIFPVGAGEES